jgi:flagellin-like hook-associated protein FlgL
MSGIVLSSAIRTNLTTLQNTSALQSKIQERLSTGKKVNSAIDNASSFFTASGLNRRANDLTSLLDSMQQGIKTLEAADNAMKAITKNIETMQANIRQARSDKSFKGTNLSLDATAIGTSSAKKLSISGGTVGTTAIDVDLQNAQGVLTGGAYSAMDFAEAGDNITFKVTLNGSTTLTSVTVEQGTAANSLKVTVGSTVTDNIATTSRAAVTGAEMATALTQGFTAAGTGIGVALTGGALVFTASTANAASSSTAAVTMSNFAFVNGGGGTAIAAAQFGFTAGGVGVSAGGTASTTGLAVKTVDQLVTDINANTSLSGKVKASNEGGKLRIENLSAVDLSVVGATSAGVVNGGTGASNTATVGSNDVRKGLVTQFNDLRTQLDKLASDASYNGINLVKADKLKVTFNETGTSSIDIQAKDVSIGAADAAEFSDDADLDARLDELANALTTVQTQSSSFGAALTTVQNRQDFTKAMIGTLQTGADSLTLADANEEAAKLLSLNTRQQLAQTTLSLASQADQAVLRLF